MFMVQFPLLRLLKLYFLLLLLVSSAAFSQEIAVLELDEGRTKHSALAYIEYLEDKSAELRFEDVTSADYLSKFTSTGDGVPSYGVTPSAYWFRLKVINPHDTPKTWWVEVDEPLLDRVDFYYAREDGSVESMVLGDNYPLHERRIKLRNLISVFEIDANESVDIMLRVKTSGALSMPLYFWDPETYPVSAVNTQMVYGAYYGLIVALFLYNLLLFFSIRDVSYLYYCAFVICYAMWQFTFNGLGYEYLWPNDGYLNVIFAVLMSNFYAIFSILFARSFLQIPKLFTGLDRWVLIMLASCVIPLFILFFVSQALAVLVNGIFMLLAMAMISCIGVYALYKGIIEARYFLIAWLTLIIGVLAFCMVLFGWLPANMFTIHAQQIGSAVEAILLSFALAHRMRLLSAENERIQTEAKQNLEKRVIERTRELDNVVGQLEEANDLLKEKSFNDGLTGIRNRYYLEEQYEKEWLRSQREGTSLSVLMIDIDHFKGINDTHGHLCGDKALCFVADMISRIVKRPSDIVARYGGEEFLVVLPNTEKNGAYAIAEKIRKSLQDAAFEFDNAVIHLTVSIGYATQSSNWSGCDSHEFINMADQALYNAKKDGRNKVVLAAA